MNIERIIKALNSGEHYIEAIFMQGACYKFHLFLKELFPDALPLISKEKDHIISLINGNYYDVTGKVNCEGYHSLTGFDLRVAKSWSFSDRMLLSIGECSYCEEPILVSPKSRGK